AQAHLALQTPIGLSWANLVRAIRSSFQDSVRDHSGTPAQPSVSPLERELRGSFRGLQPSPPALGYLDASSRGGVVANEDALCLGHEPLAHPQLELELEALGADPRRPHAYRHGLAEADLRAEVDLGSGE